LTEGGVTHQGYIITICDAIDDGIDMGAIVERETIIDNRVFGVAKGSAIASGRAFGYHAGGGGVEGFLVEHHQDKEVGG